MKHLLQTLVLHPLFCFSAFAQQSDTFKLSMDMPEAGKEIRFVYTISSSRMLNPTISLYYDRGNSTQHMALIGKFNSGKKEGTFVLPDSIQAFCIMPNNRYSATKAYVFQVYKNGTPMKGALAATAHFYGGAKPLESLRDVKKSLYLYRQEFAINPQLKPQNLLAYFQTGSYNPDSLIVNELHKTWRDSLKHGTNEPFLYRLYDITLQYGVSGLKEKHRSQLLKKYPKGLLAINEANNAYFIKNPEGDYLERLHYLEREFPDAVNSGSLDQANYNYARLYFKNGDHQSGEILLQKIKDKKLLRTLYADAASDILHHGKNQNIAAAFIKKAIDMAEEKSGYTLDYLYTSARIQRKLGNLENALADMKATLSSPYNRSVYTEVYLNYLLEAGKYESAMEVATAYIKGHTESVPIKRMFLDTYEKLMGSKVGAEEQYISLVKLRDAQFELPVRNMLDVQAINFKAHDVYGNPFSLSSLKGKSVVLYFFTVSGNRRNMERNDCFNKVAAEYKSRTDVVFVGIDINRVDAVHQESGQRERLKVLKSYIERRKVTYRTILDEWKPLTDKRPEHSRIAYDYSVDGSSQFYIINKKGIVKYRTMHIKMISITFTES